MRPQQKLSFLFYVKKYFGIKKKRLQKLMTLWQIWHCFLLRWENMLVVLKWPWYLWPFMAITKAQLLPFDKWNMRYPSLNFCNFCLLKIFTYIKALFFLINRFCPAMCFFFFFDFLIPISTEATHSSCYFQIKCFHSLLYLHKRAMVLYSNSYNDANLSES